MSVLEFWRNGVLLRKGICKRVTRGLLVGVLLLIAGCGTIVTPPESVREPATVVLIDHGAHPSLVLPVNDQQSVLYAYGDWNYFALRNTNMSSGIIALFWPTSGTLGRMKIDASTTKFSVRERFRVDDYFRIAVERKKVRKLRRRLERLYENHRDTEHYSESADMYFVEVPETYWLLNNCNHVTVRWLERLGCRTSGSAMTSVFEMDRKNSGRKP